MEQVEQIFWLWEEAGKRVNPISAFRSPSSVSFIAGGKHWVGNKAPSLLNIFCSTQETQNTAKIMSLSAGTATASAVHGIWGTSLPTSSCLVSSLISQPSFPPNSISIQGIILVPFLVGDAEVMVPTASGQCWRDGGGFLTLAASPGLLLLVISEKGR